MPLVVVLDVDMLLLLPAYDSHGDYGTPIKNLYATGGSWQEPGKEESYSLVEQKRKIRKWVQASLAI